MIDNSPEFKSFEKNVFLKRELERDFNKLLRKLEIPVYNDYTTYNYYDVLTAFVQKDYTQQHRKEFQERQQRIKDHKEAGEELVGFDIMKRDSKEFWDLSLLNQELFLEMDDIDFRKVINRLELKDSRIAKLDEMQKLRTKQGRKVNHQIDTYEGRHMITSSHIVGASIIRRLYNEIKERRVEKAEWLIELAELRRMNGLGLAQSYQSKELNEIPEYEQSSSSQTKVIIAESLEQMSDSQKSTERFHEDKIEQVLSQESGYLRQPTDTMLQNQAKLLKEVASQSTIKKHVFDSVDRNKGLILN